jgi:hypothetical protein
MNYNREEPQPHDGWQDENPLYREQVPLVSLFSHILSQLGI